MLGETTEAANQYEQAISHCPDYLEATIKLGTQYLYLNEEELAAQQFNIAVEINDKIVDAYIGLANAQKLSDQTSEALTTLSLAGAIQPNSSLLFAQVATLQFRLTYGESLLSHNENTTDKLIEAVISMHQQQIIQQPQNPNLFYRLGVLMMSVGRVDMAIGLFQNALEINPVYSRARSKKIVCLSETNQEKLALSEMTAPDHLDKAMLDLYYKTVLLYCNKIKFASSLINLERYMEDNLSSSEATLNISIILQNLGLLDRADATWEDLLATTDQMNNGQMFFSDDF